MEVLFVRVNGNWRFEGEFLLTQNTPERRERVLAKIEEENGPGSYRIFELPD